MEGTDSYDMVGDTEANGVCYVGLWAKTGRTGVEKQFRVTLEGMMGFVELEVMMCIAGDCNAHVGVAEPGEEECIGKFGFGTRNREGQDLMARHRMTIAGLLFQKWDSH